MIEITDIQKERVKNIGVCFDCGFKRHWYMVTDKVWLEAWPNYKKLKHELSFLFKKEGILKQGLPCLCLCLDCLQIRLKRSIVIEDFLITAGINGAIIWAYELGLKLRN